MVKLVDCLAAKKFHLRAVRRRSIIYVLDGSWYLQIQAKCTIIYRAQNDGLLISGNVTSTNASYMSKLFI